MRQGDRWNSTTALYHPTSVWHRPSVFPATFGFGFPPLPFSPLLHSHLPPQEPTCRICMSTLTSFLSDVHAAEREATAGEERCIWGDCPWAQDHVEVEHSFQGEKGKVTVLRFATLPPSTPYRPGAPREEVASLASFVTGIAPAATVRVVCPLLSPQPVVDPPCVEAEVVWSKILADLASALPADAWWWEQPDISDAEAEECLRVRFHLVPPVEKRVVCNRLWEAAAALVAACKYNASAVCAVSVVRRERGRSGPKHVGKPTLPSDRDAEEWSEC